MRCVKRWSPHGRNGFVLLGIVLVCLPVVSQTKKLMAGQENLSTQCAACHEPVVKQYLTTRHSYELESNGPAPASSYRFTGYRKFLDPDGYRIRAA